ncbi:hypothetical protein C8Q76DRAFT_620411 [Earliella scabrosa]|nr:hypothetical protein C8Q76DRAFT_620411 [Earliella scabrosa]
MIRIIAPLIAPVPIRRVYGRWKESIQLSLPSAVHPVVAHRYIAPVRPEVAVQVGMRVQVIALSPAVYRTLHTPLRSKPLYDVYDPHIEGTVIGVKHDSADVVTVAIWNERPISKVAIAIVTLPYIPDITMTLKDVETTCPWLFGLAVYPPGVVTLEEGAEVVDHLGDLPTPPVVLCYPDPEMYEHDTLVTDLGRAGVVGRRRARMSCSGG